MPKPPTNHNSGGSANIKNAAAQRVNGAAADFRSPVGCTGATPGEEQFLAWCAEERVRFPSSQLAVLPATGRALVASRAIKMGEVVVEVPDDAVLMADNCSIRELLEEYGMCKPADDEILEVQGLIIAVMYERSRGKESRWSPYLNLIPDDMTHMPLYWKRSEFQELRGTAAYDKMMGQVQHPADAPTQVPLLWSEVVEPFIQEQPQLGLPHGKAGYDLYRWATCAVASYSFILGDDKYQAMVPVWDLLNHVTGRVNVRLHHCGKRHVLQMLATRDIPRGGELVNNYGELSNAELLRGYGFVEETNKNNHVQVPLGFVVRAASQLLQADEAAAAAATAGPGPGSSTAAATSSSGAPSAALRSRLSSRLRLARRCGLLPAHYVFKVYGGGRPPPTHLTALIHLLLASDDDAAVIRASARRAIMVAAAAADQRDGDQPGKGKRKGRGVGKATKLSGQAAAAAAGTVVPAAAAGGEAALARVARVYGAIVERMLGRYGGGLAEDEQLLAARDALPPRLHAAVLARKPEKEALLSLREVVGRKSALKMSLVGEARSSQAAITSFGRAVITGGKVAGDEGQAGGDGRRAKVVMGKGGYGPDAANAERFAAAQFSFGFAL